MPCVIKGCKNKNVVTGKMVCKDHETYCKKCATATPNAKVVSGSQFCAKHKREDDQNKLTQQTQSKQMVKIQEKAVVTQGKVDVEGKKREADEKEKSELITKTRKEWAVKVNEIVTAVKGARSTYGNPNINAGTNTFKVNPVTNKFSENGTKTVRFNTDGGSESAISLPLPTNRFKLTLGDITKGMTGFKSSDSSGAKFDFGGIFVHCH